MLRQELSALVRRVMVAEGTNAAGAIRDLFTDLIHISRDMHLDPEDRFESAMEVADAEDGQ